MWCCAHSAAMDDVMVMEPPCAAAAEAEEFFERALLVGCHAGAIWITA
jgi:hypothetical protein